eukprot:scaffold145172_cov15-Tisochrysis_lutea.AAC.1
MAGQTGGLSTPGGEQGQGGCVRPPHCRALAPASHQPSGGLPCDRRKHYFECCHGNINNKTEMIASAAKTILTKKND